MDIVYEHDLICSPLILTKQPSDYYLASQADLSESEKKHFLMTWGAQFLPPFRIGQGEGSVDLS